MTSSLKTLTIVCIDWGLPASKILETTSKHYGMHVLETGVLIRELLNTNTPLANEMKQYIEAGKMVPTKLVNAYLVDQIHKVNTPILLSGYPRTVEHYKALTKLLKKNKIQFQGTWYFKIKNPEHYKRLFYEETEQAIWVEKYGQEILNNWTERYKTYSQNLKPVLEVMPQEQIYTFPMEFRPKAQLENYIKLRLPSVEN